MCFSRFRKQYVKSFNHTSILLQVIENLRQWVIKRVNHSLKMWYNRNNFITFVLLSHKAETTWNSFIVAVRPVCNVMPENITAIVVKVVVAVLFYIASSLTSPSLPVFATRAFSVVLYRYRLCTVPIIVWLYWIVSLRFQSNLLATTANCLCGFLLSSHSR